MGTSTTDKLISKNTVKQVFHYLLFFCAFCKILNSVNQHMEKFVDVLLHPWVDRAAINVLEGFAEVLGVIILLLELHKRTKYFLYLVKTIVTVRQGPHIAVLHFEHRLPKRGHHIQLLHNAVYVADAAYVFQTNVPSRTLRNLVLRSD